MAAVIENVTVDACKRLGIEVRPGPRVINPRKLLQNGLFSLSETVVFGN